jgi:transcriptional antiterminator/mannitol/fructose-specific phosphotransferase system IIA component (Ntr-type)
LSHKEPVAISKLADRFDIGERTLHYNIKEIDYFLRELGLSLERKAGKGVWINVPDGMDLNALANNIALLPVQDILLENNEKRSFIISRLLMMDEPISIKNLADEIYVGRNTIAKFLSEVEEWFKRYKVRLIRRTNFGLKLEHTKTSWRNAMVALLCGDHNSDWYYKILDKDGKPKFTRANQNDSAYIFNDSSELLSEKEIENFYDVIVEFEGKKDFCFSEFAYSVLIFQLKIVVIRARMGCRFVIPQTHEAMLETVPEYAVAKRLLRSISKMFKIEIAKEETSYIALQLMSVEKAQEKFSLDNDKGCIAYDIVDDVICKTQVPNTGRQKLVQRVNLNIQYAVKSCMNNMYTYNPLLLRLVKQHHRLYDIVLQSCKAVNSAYSVDLREDEVAIIASSFIDETHTNISRKGVLRVLVVCMNGVGTARMLSGRLKAAFPNIQIADTLSVLDLNKTKLESVELIISTVKLDIPYPIPTITVSPLLDDESIGQISTFINMRYLYSVMDGSRDKLTLDLICDIIDKYVGLNYNHNVVRDKLKIILGFNHNSEKEGQTLMLSSLISEQRITLHYSADENDYESVVREAGRLLLEDNCITDEYIDAMVNSIKNIGSYIVIAKHLALPHARPEDGVLKCGISMLVLDTPVNFGHVTNDPVKVVFCLAATDDKSHLKALENIATLAINAEYFNKMLSIDTPYEMYHFISEVCRKVS